jgi:hypothetical protein
VVIWVGGFAKMAVICQRRSNDEFAGRGAYQPTGGHLECYSFGTDISRRRISFAGTGLCINVGIGWKSTSSDSPWTGGTLTSAWSWRAESYPGRVGSRRISSMKSLMWMSVKLFVLDMVKGRKSG